MDVATLADEPVSSAARDELQRLARRVAVERLGPTRWVHGAMAWLRGDSLTEGLFYSSKLATHIRQWSGETKYDAVIGVCSSMAQYLPACPSPVKIVELMDVDSLKWQQYSETSRGLRRWVYSREAERVRRLESDLADFVDSVTLVSEPEAELFRQATGHHRAYGIPNGVDLDYFSPHASTAQPSNVVVFVGALDYKANVDGVFWFAEHVWPQLRAQHGDIIFQIVGRKPSDQIRALNELEGIEVVGEVPDVRPYVANARLVVVPLRVARGIQNKVLEALAMSKALVASSEALTGLATVPGKDVLQATTPREWLSQVSAAWEDSELRNQLGRAGRKYAEDHHSWEACLSPITGLLTQQRMQDATRATVSAT